ncbi:MAG: intradiol ring-cleavage dioxygenase [Microbacterium sp.]
MARIPEPDQTPAGPAYEGRLLDRADEEVVDQGVAFDLRTLISRRGILSLVGLGAGAVTLAACSAATTTSSAATSSTSSGTQAATTGLPAAEIPDETAGPYPGDGSNGPDILEESGIVRSDIRSSLNGGTTAEGVPLTFSITVTDMANDDAPFEGVAVYAWHCNAAGLYSMYSEGVEDETYLRGVQVADATGTVTFTSIFPACYSGRWPHIHFEVYPDVDSITDSTNAIATSQMAMPESVLADVYALSEYTESNNNLSQVTLDTDNVFGDDDGALQQITISGDVSSGFVSSFVARVDTTTAPTGGTVLSETDGSGGGSGGGPGGDGGGNGGGPGGDSSNAP